MRLGITSALLLALCGGGPFAGAVKYLEVKEGEDLNFKCSFYSSGFARAFCKHRCETYEDFLVTLYSVLRTRGRFTIEFEKRPSYPDLMKVTIRNVQMSDAGWYSCALFTWDTSNGYRQTFKVVDVNIYVLRADGSRPAPVPEGPGASEAPQDQTPLSDVALYVGLSLSALLILAVTLTILHWRKRVRAAPDCPLTPGYTPILKRGPEEAGGAETPSACFTNPGFTDSSLLLLDHRVQFVTL